VESQEVGRLKINAGLIVLLVLAGLVLFLAVCFVIGMGIGWLIKGLLRDMDWY
jgi:hypothetical protein